MITLQTLLAQLNELNIKLKTNLNYNNIIDNIEILESQNLLHENYLYITDDYNLALKYISYSKLTQNIFVISNDEIENNYISVLITNYSKDHIYNILCQYMIKNYSLASKKYSIYNSLYEAKNMSEILNIAEKYINNPIFLVDTSYSVLCRSNLAEKVTTSIEKANDSYYLIFDIVDLMKQHKCIDNIYSSSQPFFHYDDENLIFCSIKTNDITTSYICVLENNKSFNNEDLVYALSNVISTFTEKEHIFISNSGLCDEYYLIDLISNKIENVDYIKERLKYSNFTLKENFTILSIPFTQKYKDYRYNFGLKELMECSKHILKNCLCAYYENNIIFLVSSEHDSVISNDTKKAFEEFLKLNNLKCGISFPFNDLMHIKDFLEQSIFTANTSYKPNESNFIFYFEDYVDYYLFSIAEGKDNYKNISLSTLVNPLLYKLIDYDKQNNSELFKTLKFYIENNKNGNLTSQALNINRSTFFYRFHKIEEILDINVNSIIYKLEASLKLLQYINFNS